MFVTRYLLMSFVSFTQYLILRDKKNYFSILFVVDDLLCC
ncbi:hypothetical protein ykris0001_41370 [Yersinia kristensenii ATCC 33638]|nr:hypothetical protein ykris0001_41370 [Yersinia kristensenii ATCC 33638]